jgi:hypothetical protein
VVTVDDQQSPELKRVCALCVWTFRISDAPRCCALTPLRDGPNLGIQLPTRTVRITFEELTLAARPAVLLSGQRWCEQKHRRCGRNSRKVLETRFAGAGA